MSPSTLSQSTIPEVVDDIVSQIPSLADWTFRISKTGEESEHGEVTYTCELEHQYKVGPKEDDVVSLVCTVTVPSSEASEGSKASKPEPRQAQFEIYPVSKSTSFATHESLELENIKYYAAPVKLPVKYTGLANWDDDVKFEGDGNDTAIKAAAQRCIEEMLTQGSDYRAKIESMMPKETRKKKRRNRPGNARDRKRSGD
jgi:hypothetical protein